MDKHIYNDKMRKNLKKIYNRIQNKSKAALFDKEEVLFLAIGGYNRTKELLVEMGLESGDIHTAQKLDLTPQLATQTHQKKAIIIKKINYVTSVTKTEATFKRLDLNVADSFYEQLMVYKDASWLMSLPNSKKESWKKPTIIILDDQTLNLQFGGYRFNNNPRIGFTQMRNRNAEPQLIINEIEKVEEADYMMFSLYKENGADEAEVIAALNRLRIEATRQVGGSWYFKPTEYKRICESNELAQAMREMDALNITQFKSNKKIGKENARWIVIPDESFDFSGLEYKDEEDLFEEELLLEQESEEEYAERQEELLNKIMSQTIHLNARIGYNGREMNAAEEKISIFATDIEKLSEGQNLLEAASTKEEYEAIKKYELPYFLDGRYKDNIRNDKNYQGGKRLISLDLDDVDYTREEIEDRLESQGLFGIVYPTAKYYFDQSNRWRVILVADKPMDKDQYKNTVNGVASLLDLEDNDDSSAKLSQLMGLPLNQDDVSFVIGSEVNVGQFDPKSYPNTKKIVQMQPNNPFHGSGSKPLADFNHKQAQLLKQAQTTGIPEGSRNDTYRSIYMFLIDTLQNPEFKSHHAEAQDELNKLDDYMARDGLGEKERSLIMRDVNNI